MTIMEIEAEDETNIENEFNFPECLVILTSAPLPGGRSFG